MRRIIVADDEPDILEVLEYNLQSQGYEVRSCLNGREAVKVAGEFTPHMVILDLMMPEMDGIEACKRIRQIENCKDALIMFLSARGEEYTQIAGFEAGAHDYLVKPFSIKVLMSKVNALFRIRFSDHFLQHSGSINGHGLSVDRDSYTVLKNQDEISLPRKEFEILSLMASRPNRLFRREEIFSQIWGTDAIVGDRTLDVHIRNIRSKIGDSYIQTVKGLGYKFTHS